MRNVFVSTRSFSVAQATPDCAAMFDAPLFRRGVREVSATMLVALVAVLVVPPRVARMSSALLPLLW